MCLLQFLYTAFDTDTGVCKQHWEGKQVARVHPLLLTPGVLVGTLQTKPGFMNSTHFSSQSLNWFSESVKRFLYKNNYTDWLKTIIRMHCHIQSQIILNSDSLYSAILNLTALHGSILNDFICASMNFSVLHMVTTLTVTPNAASSFAWMSSCSKSLSSV